MRRTVRIDTVALARRVRTRGVKQAWLAHCLGVHRKTVSRWLKGTVQRMEHDNAIELARLLDCPVSAIVLQSPVDGYATAAHQVRAARLVQQRKLVERLSPTGEWGLAEGVLEATLHPDLPAAERGRMLNLLSTVSWRQGRYDDARAHAEEALQLGERSQDAPVCAKAHAHLGVIRWFEQDHPGAERSLSEALRIGCFDQPRDHASVLFNLGMLQRSQARFEESLAHQLQSIEIFEAQDWPFNLAIAWKGVALTHIDIGVLTEAPTSDEALGALRHAEREAGRCGFTGAIREVALLRDEVEALMGSPDVVLRDHCPACRKHTALFAHAARTARLLGHPDVAEDLLRQGLAAAGDPSFERGLLLQERARLHDMGTPHEDWRSARAQFEAVGLPGRARGGVVG
ncbi:MAG: tetratricopeptide repeat protein [Myxococcales bacterium]|nr:tetratricopeptide repeat protein [Myxococcales bacterium]